MRWRPCESSTKSSALRSQSSGSSTPPSKSTSLLSAILLALRRTALSKNSKATCVRRLDLTSSRSKKSLLKEPNLSQAPKKDTTTMLEKVDLRATDLRGSLDETLLAIKLSAKEATCSIRSVTGSKMICSH